MQCVLSYSRAGPRKKPPHQVEVEAIEQNISRICHKIYFPNDTSEVNPTPPMRETLRNSLPLPHHWCATIVNRVLRTLMYFRPVQTGVVPWPPREATSTVQSQDCPKGTEEHSRLGQKAEKARRVGSKSKSQGRDTLGF